MLRTIGKRARGRAFKTSNHDLVKLIYSLLDAEMVLVDACQKGHVELTKMILSSERYDIDELNEAFSSALSYGHLDIAKYILNEYCVNCDLSAAFKQNCQHNNLEACLWIVNDIHFYTVPIELLIEMFNYTCCNNGDKFTMVLWLYSLIGSYVDLSAKKYYRFIDACSNGNIMIAKWLYTITGLDITTGKGGAFRNSCINDYTEIMRWLHSLNINIVEYVTNNDIVKINNKETIIWLLNMGAKINPDVVFKIMCCHGKLEMAQWFVQIPYINVDILKYYEDIKKHCEKKNNHAVLEWIASFN